MLSSKNVDREDRSFAADPSGSADLPGSPGSGPLVGLRVIEIASEYGAYAGKLMADYGAEVLLVEPPGGHKTRCFAPLASEAGPQDNSLWFWHYNTSKSSLELDLETNKGAAAFIELCGHADIVLEAEPVGHLASLGINQPDIRSSNPKLVWVSMTSAGLDDQASKWPFTDLTLMAAGGIVWSCGYDNPELPPVRPPGNQSFQTASIWAAVGAMVAIQARSESGRGQLVDVSMHAAVNVTTEQATQWWNVAGEVVHRQTARHASHLTTEPVVQHDRNGYEVHTGYPPHTAERLTALVKWVDDLGIREFVPLIAVLEMAIKNGGIDRAKLSEDDFTQECYRTARDALAAIAAQLDGHEFFMEAQRRGLPVGMINSAEEAMSDPHLRARQFPVALDQPQLGRPVIYPGLPIRFTGSPGEIRLAPRPDSSRPDL